MYKYPFLKERDKEKFGEDSHAFPNSEKIGSSWMCM
jgi:hypothetical protein